jgi:hypothetical protein
MREFITAVEDAVDQEETEEPGLIFAIDGQEMRAYKPTEGQFALLMVAMGRHASNMDQFAGIIDFFISVLDEPSEHYVISRMQTRDQIIPLEKIVEIMEWMIEEWGGRPFQKPSVSTSSRRNGGRKSTARTPALT